MARPKAPPARVRNVWVPDEVWREAQQLAYERGTTPSAIMVGALRRYVKRHAKAAHDG